MYAPGALLCDGLLYLITQVWESPGPGVLGRWLRTNLGLLGTETSPLCEQQVILITEPSLHFLWLPFLEYSTAWQTRLKQPRFGESEAAGHFGSVWGSIER